MIFLVVGVVDVAVSAVKLSMVYVLHACELAYVSPSAKLSNGRRGRSSNGCSIGCCSTFSYSSLVVGVVALSSNC